MKIRVIAYQQHEEEWYEARREYRDHRLKRKAKGAHAKVDIDKEEEETPGVLEPSHRDKNGVSQ